MIWPILLHFKIIKHQGYLYSACLTLFYLSLALLFILRLFHLFSVLFLLLLFYFLFWGSQILPPLMQDTVAKIPLEEYSAYPMIYLILVATHQLCANETKTPIHIDKGYCWRVKVHLDKLRSELTTNCVQMNLKRSIHIHIRKILMHLQIALVAELSTDVCPYKLNHLEFTGFLRVLFLNMGATG